MHQGIGPIQYTSIQDLPISISMHQCIGYSQCTSVQDLPNESIQDLPNILMHMAYPMHHYKNLSNAPVYGTYPLVLQCTSVRPTHLYFNAPVNRTYPLVLQCTSVWDLPISASMHQCMGPTHQCFNVPVYGTYPLVLQCTSVWDLLVLQLVPQRSCNNAQDLPVSERPILEEELEGLADRAVKHSTLPQLLWVKKIKLPCQTFLL